APFAQIARPWPWGGLGSTAQQPARGAGGENKKDTAPAAAGGGGPPGLIVWRAGATALGGSCFAGPRFGGGYRVHAVLPVA
ncbi:hypothetical protein ACFXA3_28830, partial [Streptomyces sp. NPDC059456]